MSTTTGVHILLVDDSHTSRDFYATLFGKNGYQTSVACDSRDALRQLDGSDFDIAIIDYFMPGGNGDELCRAIKGNPRTVGVTAAILTGSYSDELVRLCLEAGASDCLFKEEPPELLLTRVAAMARAVRAHRTVEQERRFLSGILSTLSEGVYGVDKQNRITFMNPAGLAILGYSSETEVAGRNPHLLFHYALVDGRPNPAETCYLNQAYELGDVLPNWESVFWTRAGKPIWVECNVVPLVYGGVREGSVVAFRDVTLVREHMEHLHWQAYHDSLTRLPNRRFFADVLEREFYRLKRSEDASAVIYVDLDKFKQVNDLAGHAAGDRLLVELSELLARRLRATDVVARLGGDEFGIILSNVDRRSAVSVAEKFRVMIARHEFEHAGRQYRVDASIGLVLMDRYSWSPDTVLSQADKASYLSKRAGGATVHVYVPEDGNDTV